MDKIGVRCVEEIMKRVGARGDLLKVLDKIDVHRQSLYQWGEGRYTPTGHVLRKMALEGYDVIYILTGVRCDERKANP